MVSHSSKLISFLLSVAFHVLLFVSFENYEIDLKNVQQYGESYANKTQLKILYLQRQEKKRPKNNQRRNIDKPNPEMISQQVDLSMSGLKKSEHSYGKQTRLAEYATLVRSLIAQNQYYPTIAKKLQQQGKVQVSFEIIYPNKIQNIKIHQPSAYEMLNTSALSAVDSLEDLPPIPEDLQTKKLTLVVPIEFKLI